MFCSKGLTKEDEEYNESLIKPYIPRVEPSGAFELRFSASRIREGNCIRKEEPITEIDGNDLEKLRVYGKHATDEPIQGVSMYIEVSEMSDPEKLQFTYEESELERDKRGF